MAPPRRSASWALRLFLCSLLGGAAPAALAGDAKAAPPSKSATSKGEGGQPPSEGDSQEVEIMGMPDGQELVIEEMPEGMTGGMPGQEDDGPEGPEGLAEISGWPPRMSSFGGPGGGVQVVRGGGNAIPPELLDFLGVHGPHGPRGGPQGGTVVIGGDDDGFGGGGGDVQVVNMGDGPMMMGPMGPMAMGGPMGPMGGGDPLDAIFQHMLGGMLGDGPMRGGRRPRQRRGGLGDGASQDSSNAGGGGGGGMPRSCSKDFQEYCSRERGSMSPARCLAKHVGKISDTCKVDLFLAPCKEEVGKHCDLLEQGMLTCLHAHYTDIGSQCQAAVKKTEEALASVKASPATGAAAASTSNAAVSSPPTLSPLAQQPWPRKEAAAPTSAASTSATAAAAPSFGITRAGAHSTGLGVRPTVLPAFEASLLGQSGPKDAAAGVVGVGARADGISTGSGTGTSSFSLRNVSLLAVAGVAFYAYRKYAGAPKAKSKGGHALLGDDEATL